jgi:hypothetical protein
MSGSQNKAHRTAAFAIAVVAGLLAGCAQSGATDARMASTIRDRDSETIKPAGYIDPNPASTQDHRG